MYSLQRSWTFCVLFIIVILLGSCDCFNTCYEDIRFSIVDKQTGQDLVFGPGALYSKDSLRIGPTSMVFFQRVFSDSISKTLYAGISYDTAILKISANDFDTVITRYHREGSNRCCPNGYATPEEVRYNGVVAARNGKTFLFRK